MFLGGRDAKRSIPQRTLSGRIDARTERDTMPGECVLRRHKQRHRVSTANATSPSPLSMALNCSQYTDQEEAARTGQGLDAFFTIAPY